MSYLVVVHIQKQHFPAISVLASLKIRSNYVVFKKKPPFPVFCHQVSILDIIYRHSLFNNNTAYGALFTLLTACSENASTKIK